MVPTAFINYLLYFHTERDYFECHEVLEEYWKSSPVKQQEQVWVAFIQLAVSLYHHRRGNFAGASKMLKSAMKLFQDHKKQVTKLHLDPQQLIWQLEKRLAELETKTAYYSINLPLHTELLNHCQSISLEKGLEWGIPSDMHNTYLLNKHTKRDRSQVIKERENQRKLRSE